MTPGDHVFYTIQHRTTQKSPWLEPSGELSPYEEGTDWSFSSFDHFGRALDPWAGSGNDYKPVDSKATDQKHAVRCITGQHGWWDLKYAKAALKRVKQLDAKGAFDSKWDGTVTQAIRHEFRIVRVSLSYQVEVYTKECFAPV